MKYYDVTTKGFYEELSENRIQLTDECWQKLLDKQSNGGTIQVVDNQLFCVLSTEVIQNGVLVDISDSDEYKNKINAEKNELKKIELQKQIDILDIKSVRALREGGVKDSTTGQTWLDYYTKQIISLREQLNDLNV